MKSAELSTTIHRGVISVVLMLAIVLLPALTPSTQAQTFTTPHDFTGGSDGGTSSADVIQDPAGNLYGITLNGGATGSGTVFEIDTAGWKT